MNVRPGPTPHFASRRMVLAGLGAATLFPVLAACGAEEPSEQAADDVAAAAEVELPTYAEQTAVTPDIPGRNGSTPGYTTYPADLPQTVELSLIHISEPTRRLRGSRMPSSA